jgi:hypothetical protein
MQADTVVMYSVISKPQYSISVSYLSWSVFAIHECDLAVNLLFQQNETDKSPDLRLAGPVNVLSPVDWRLVQVRSFHLMVTGHKCYIFRFCCFGAYGCMKDSSGCGRFVWLCL